MEQADENLFDQGIDERLIGAQLAEKKNKMKQSSIENKNKEYDDENHNSGIRKKAKSGNNVLNKNKKLKKKFGAENIYSVKLATNGILRFAWIILIPSFGFSLIYINIHVFLRMIFGENLFCKLGDEWIPKKVQAVSNGSEGKTIGVFEVMALLFLDLVAFFFIIIVLGLISLVLSWFGQGFWGKIWGTVKAIANLGWGSIKVLVELFGDIYKK